ncbi:MAG: polyprenol phosphomannose-dependent alpha 1,6 mannosyltransferase MptB [Acidimicrobiales bacterium]
MSVGSLESDLVASVRAAAPERSRRRRGLVGIAALGALGSGLLALASDLPASPYGPHAGGSWPLAASGHAPGWEGPGLPAWAGPANSGPGIASGHLLLLGAAVAGLVLLGLAWLSLWRAVRTDATLRWRRLWWVLAAWTVPLLLAAPFASQDVWVYVAQGKLVASGLGAASPVHLLGHHSPWVAAVDPRYLTGPSIYGPGAVDLSALFARGAGGHPWIAVEGWRLAVIASLLLCAWGVARAAAGRGINPVEAVVAGVANPAVLVVFVAGIHNDAVMISLIVAGVALALAERPWWALCLAALAVTVKAPAALAVLTIAWWYVRGSWRRRAGSLAGGLALTLAALLAAGLACGGDGFSWLHSASVATVASSFSLLNLAGTTSSSLANVIQLGGIALALAIVLLLPRRASWVGALALGLGVMAVCATNPQPWYVLWALPLLACTGCDARLRRLAICMLCAMAAWSVLPLGNLVWFAGIAGLTWTVARWEHQRQEARPAAAPHAVVPHQAG